MRRLYVLLMLVGFGLGTAHAQLPDFSIGPDWTSTDLDTVEHNMYSYLDSGYAVFMDLSAAWCGPCWTIHQNGLLDNLYSDWDRPGTNELRVFYMESEANNTRDQLFGISGGTNATATQGDWVTGHDFPFIDDASIATAYGLSAYPTLVFVGADRLTRTTVGSPGPSQETIRAWMDADGGPVVQGVDARAVQYRGDLISICGDQFDAGVLIQNHGTDTLTNATVEFYGEGTLIATMDWTGSLASYETEEVMIPNVINNGSLEFQVRIVADGDVAPDNDMMDVEGFSVLSVTDTPSFDLENSDPASIELPDGVYNEPGDDFEAFSVSRAVFQSNGQPWPSPVGGQGQSEFAILWNFYQLQQGEGSVYFDRTDLSANPQPFLRFYHAYRQYDANSSDRLEVSISTNCGLSWTEVYSEAGSDLATLTPSTNYFIAGEDDWMQNDIDLTAFTDEEDVTIRFTGVTNFGNSLFVDDIEVYDASVATTEVSYINDFKVFPNPATEVVNINLTADESSDVLLSVTDMTGRVITQASDRLEVGQNQRSLDVTNYQAGLYTVSFMDGKSVSKKVFSVIR